MEVFTLIQFLLYSVEQTWRNWRQGTIMNILDPTLKDGSRNEMLRCIHIALLCVQENSNDRPTMVSVISMLNSFSVSLQLPSQPALYLQTLNETDISALMMDEKTENHSTEEKEDTGSKNQTRSFDE